MVKDTRQTTLDVPSGEISTLEDIDWTFEGADTSYLTHGLHPYPARMIPQIPDSLLNYFKSEGIVSQGDTVYDPFGGSGTSAVEARLHGLDAETNDINPLACLVTRAKALPLDTRRLKEARDSLLNGLTEDLREVRHDYEEGRLELGRDSAVRDGWFPEPQLSEMLHIRRQIDGIESEYGADIARFFRVVLSAITRKVSYQRNGEYKRYRMPEEKRADHDPDVLELFQSKLKSSIELMREYSSQVDHSLTTTVHYSDSRTATDNENPVAENSADVVITSPPYGDHGTTVAYGQFSQDPAIIAGDCGYDEMKAVDKNGLGGSNSDLEPMAELEEWSRSFGATMDALREKDGRADDAMKFVRDYFEVMKEVAKILKPGQPAAWVVANRTMSRVNIPLHLVTRELCEELGYEHHTTLPREIPTKTLPWENAPENVAEQKGDLMANENIVVTWSPE